ncbi:tetratricopeptide repeat protein [Dactylosporangium aurantiacum]|uniref:Tetratricopeptide repeat protein n=1 Tax=Dactylosporangium aurantiacum TaxID=35754 RepID=A0A9Q9ISJ5_9ACTN|nr:tetratricopeptide repeat protein [Dactylosporangium aurantiacum]MDG6106291.1 tetratricopeptide repeat protein [Dactylosporangium aurantiacum]UWZ58213.1 tetratricopeptide repeat protein [Dactylosporangium aurantiacum]
MTTPAGPAGDRHIVGHSGAASVAGVGFANTGIVDGDVTIGSIGYIVSPFPTEPPTVPASSSPSRFLDARWQVVPFHGRDEELAELSSWRDGTATRAVRLVHGTGGQGKTRLATQFAIASAKAGWEVVAVRPSGSPAATGTPAQRPAGGWRGLLAIVDYAERWPSDDLRKVLNEGLPGRSGGPVRVLLLTRSVGYWWMSLTHELDTTEVRTDELELKPLADTDDERQTSFALAVAAFAEKLGATGTVNLPAPQLHGEGSRLVLATHMAALDAVTAHVDDRAAAAAGRPAHPARAAPTDMIELSVNLLKREIAHWQRLHDARQIAVNPSTMARCVYIATLTGPRPRAKAVRTLRRLGFDDAGQAVDDHAMCYPSELGKTVLEPLYPDRLGEDFLALTTPGSGVARHLVDPWAKKAAKHLLTRRRDGNPPAYTPAAVTVLIETARRWPHFAADVLYPLLRKHPELAKLAGGSAVARLAAIPDVEISVLEAIETVLPKDRHVDFDIAIAAVDHRLTAHRVGVTGDPAERARLYVRSAQRQSNAGFHEGALTASSEAIPVLRRLADDDPDRYVAGLADAIDLHGIYLYYTRHAAEALATGEEAVRLFRRLVESGRVELLDGLARALANVSVRYPAEASESGLRAALEAVEIQRTVGADVRLGLYLNNLVIMLSRMGRDDEALDYSREALEIIHAMAAADSSKWAPDLARHLTVTGRQFAALDRWEEALATATEAVRVESRLVEANRALHEPDLAEALNFLSNALTRLGHREQAVTAGMDAVAAYRRLNGAGDATLRYDLGTTLWRLGLNLTELSRHDEAVSRLTEALTIFRELHRSSEASGYQTPIASTLSILTGCYLALGRHDEALTAATEAVSTFRALAETDRERYEHRLAGALYGLTAALWHAGRHDAALETAREMVARHRLLVETDRTADPSALARSIHYLGWLLSALHHHDEALAVSEEAVERHRDMYSAAPGAHEPELANALDTFATVRLAAHRDLDAALEAAGEAVARFEQLAATGDGQIDDWLRVARETLAKAAEEVAPATPPAGA